MEQLSQCENNLTKVLDIQNERNEQKWSIEVHRAYLNWLAFYLTYDLNKAGILEFRQVVLSDSLSHVIDEMEVPNVQAAIKAYQGVG